MMYNNHCEILKSAQFSECGKYRYVLERSWDLGIKPMLIGLNPSTANAEKDDPTIRKIISLMRNFGYPGFYMCNLFALVTPYPTELQKCKDPLKDSNKYLEDIFHKCSNVIFCWGNFEVNGRDKEIIKMFPQALCFGKNKNGSPRHPLYLPKNTLLYPFLP